MTNSRTNIVWRLAAGMLVLAALLLGNAQAASAHGTEHRHVNSRMAQQIVISEHDRSVDPASGRTCDGCLDCCATGLCSMVGVALPGSPCLMMWLTLHATIYGAHETRDVARPGVAPDTPPPRSNA